jgi:hypothetical protein
MRTDERDEQPFRAREVGGATVFPSRSRRLNDGSAVPSPIIVDGVSAKSGLLDSRIHC